MYTQWLANTHNEGRAEIIPVMAPAAESFIHFHVGTA